MEKGKEFKDYKHEIERLKGRIAQMKGESIVDLDPSFGESVDVRESVPVEEMVPVSVSERRQTGGLPETPSGPIGLDVGTGNIVVALGRGEVVKQVNAFFPINESKFAKKILAQNDVIFSEKDSKYYIIGYAAEKFANMFNTNTKRPMFQGIISSKEDESVFIIQAIIGTLITKPKNFGESICFSIPGEPVELGMPIPGNEHQGYTSGVYTPINMHESIIQLYLESLGYTPRPINEGLAVVMSELEGDNYTGIGISMGGGMCNVCLSYLSVPVVTYSIKMGGDYIDSMVSKELNEPATHVKVIKEETLDLLALPKNRLDMALYTRYSELITVLVKSMERVFSLSDRIPKIAVPIPIVLAGGTAMARGCKDKFEKALRSVTLPFKVSDVRIAKDPLNATANGALVMALVEE